jgi:hypothetical protein
MRNITGKNGLCVEGEECTSMCVCVSLCVFHDLRTPSLS